MQRRDFVRTALFGTGAACSLALPSAYAALSRSAAPLLHTSLARLEGSDATQHWRSLDQCSGDACAPPQRVRLRIDAIGFPSEFGALAIDAMFATDEGLRPYRIASHQPDSISPSSKPFSFEVDSATLAGFRAELAGTTSGSLAIASSALLGRVRPVLAQGRYVLALSAHGQSVRFDSIDVPADPGHELRDRSGGECDFAWLTFSVDSQIG
ncbi:MAG: hypothetical protein IPP82_09150 [Xanthomonadales bacterium]|nr:hypothetical protein [Xanthomonadales bacterium]